MLDETKTWLEEISDQEVVDAIKSVPRHFSASLLVDLNNTCQMGMSIVGNVQSGGPPSPCSGAVIGVGIDMLNADTFCNLLAVGCASSGKLRIQVQCADSDVSGNYTDPTSGLAQMPGAFSSGGLLWLNSGLDNGLLNPLVSGQQSLASGFAVAQGFQRTGRFVRGNLLSGDFGAGTSVGFVSNLKTTGSGAGFTYSPTSGSVNV